VRGGAWAGEIDIDKNRQLVAQLTQMGCHCRSVPTVVAFWQGQILDLFQARCRNPT